MIPTEWKFWLKLAGIAVALLLLLLAITLGPAACDRMRDQGAQIKVDQAQSNAHEQSSTEAINSIENVTANAANGVELGRQNEEDIRHAEGSNASVARAANDAGLHALCSRRGHASDPACRVQQPHPR